MEFLSDELGLFIRIISVSVLAFLFYAVSRQNSKHNYAPGPVCLPFVGYLPYIFSDNPAQILNKFRDKYGSVFGMKIGGRYCVFVNDFKSSREAFNNNRIVERPPNYLQLSPVTDNFTEMDVEKWGDHISFVRNWLRKVVLSEHRLERIILDELTRVLPKIESGVGQERFCITDAVDTSLSNTIFQTICSQWFEEDHPMMKTFSVFQRFLHEMFSSNMAKIYMPWVGSLQAMFDPTTKKVLQSAAVMREYLRDEVERRLKIHNESSENDYIDLFLTETRKRQAADPKTTYNLDVLVVNCMMLLLAGADTVRNVLEFCLMTMATFPEVQEKIHEELDTVLGRERAPLLSDKGSLPYTEATICEVQRWRTLTPINLLRVAKEDTTVQGYYVPKDALLIQNMLSCDRDPMLWPDPDSFLPERFLSKDMSRVVIPEHFSPFGQGKRMCPGNKMAQLSLFMYFVTIMQKFTISAPEGGLNFAMEHRINSRATHPVVKVSLR